VQEENFLDNHGRQCLALSRSYAEDVASSNVATERLCIRAPDGRRNTEHQSRQEDWSTADSYT
jgi:hypothetical protein